MENIIKIIMKARIWNKFKKVPKSNMESWAEREIAIAQKRERGDSGSKDGDWDYGCACYDSAMKAYKSLMNNGHSGFSIMLTKQILNRLIDGLPLTPIKDIPEVWAEPRDFLENRGYVNYQCLRMSSLFKKVYPDGTVKYVDIDSVQCVDADNGSSYHSGLVQRIIDEMYPISMPYCPPDKPTKIYCSDCLTDRKNGDYDTVGVFYAIRPDGERVEINRYFKENGRDFVEIQKDEYDARVEASVERAFKENGCEQSVIS